MPRSDTVERVPSPSDRSGVRPASGPPDPDEDSDEGLDGREDREPRPPGVDTESSKDRSSEISRKLEEWEATIREAQKSALEACRRAAWIEGTEAYIERGCDTGSEYARTVFGRTRQWWYQRVYAGRVYDSLLEKRSSSNAFDDSLPLPTNLGQTQPLHSHRDDPAFLWKAWTTAVERHGDAPRRKDVKSVVKELTSDGDPGRTEDEGDTTSDESEAAEGPSDSAGPGDSENSSDGNSGSEEEASATGDAPTEGSGETGSGSSGDVDNSNDGEGSSGGGAPGAGDCSDQDGSDTSGDRGVDGWVSVGDLAVRIPDESKDGHSLPAELAKEDIESLARAAEAKDTGLDRSSAERMIASRVWRVLSPSPHGLGAGLPEEDTTEAALRPPRLGQITGVPPGADGERVLVCPGVDLFADVVPTGAVRAILARCRDTRHHPVVFTRHLGRAAEFDLSGLWIGTPTGRSRLEETEEALTEAVPSTAVRWVLYNLQKKDKREPPTFTEGLDWVVYDPPGGAGVSLTVAETRSLVEAAEESGADWSFRAAFKTSGDSNPSQADADEDTGS